jgi:hypothetical protein
VEDFRPFLGRGPAPAIEGVARGGDGRAGFGRSATRDARDDPFVDRGYILEPVGRRDALPTDPVIGGDRNALDGGALARGEPLPDGRSSSRSFGYER